MLLPVVLIPQQRPCRFHDYCLLLLTVFSQFTPQKETTVFVMKQAVSARFHMQAAHFDTVGMQKLVDTVCFVTSLVSCFQGHWEV